MEVFMELMVVLCVVIVALDYGLNEKKESGKNRNRAKPSCKRKQFQGKKSGHP